MKWVFQIEDDGGMGGKCTCVQLIALNKNYQISKPLCYSIWFYQFKAISIFFLNQFTQYKGHKKKTFTFIVDHGWRQSRLPSLARVLLWLQLVCHKGLWHLTVRYLDKLQWRHTFFGPKGISINYQLSLCYQSNTKTTQKKMVNKGFLELLHHTYHYTYCISNLI